MRLKLYLICLPLFFSRIATACDVCQKQQPEITRGLTHGTGPESNWDWVIIGTITAITLVVLAWSVKYMIKPGEKNKDHIKQIILSSIKDEKG